MIGININTNAISTFSRWLPTVFTGLIAAAVFCAVAPFGERILFWLGSGHVPGHRYVGQEQDLAIFLAEAFVLTFLTSRVLSTAIAPRSALESHLLSQTLLTYLLFAVCSLTGGFLSAAAFSPVLGAALKGAVTMAVYPGSSLVLVSMSMAAGALIYRIRGITIWTYREWFWLYAAILVLVVSVLALIFTSRITV